MAQGLAQSDYDAVLFDIDGTLVDSLDMIVMGLGDTFEQFAGRRPSREELLPLIGLPLARQFEILGYQAKSADEVEVMDRTTIERFEVHKDLEKKFDRAIEALQAVHRSGRKTALVTSKTQPELDLFLGRFPARDYVDATVCASDVDRPKPFPDSALLACERLSVCPERAVMVGDSIYDIRCAKAAGLTAIAVSYGAAEADDLAQEAPASIFSSPEDLLNWVHTVF